MTKFNNLNAEWITFLENTLRKNLDKKLNVKDEKKEKSVIDFSPVEETIKIQTYTSKNVLKSTKNELNYNNSETFLSLSAEKRLRDILHIDKFKKMTAEEQQLVQEQLDMLNLDESEWKRRSKGHNSSHTTIEELFADSCEKFCEKLRVYITPNSEDLEGTQREYSKFFLRKFERFVHGMLEILIKEAHLKNLIPVKKVLTRDVLRTVLYQNVSKKAIFVDLVKLIMKKAHDNLFSEGPSHVSQKCELTETCFTVERIKVFYEYRRIFALNLISAVLCCVDEAKLVPGLNVQGLTEKIRNFMYTKSSAYDRKNNKWWVEDLSDSVEVILHILTVSDFFLKIAYEKKKKSKHHKIVYVLPSKADDIVFSYTKLPRIVPPAPVLPEDLDSHMKDMLFGENRITKSPAFARVLSIAQSKTFGVSDLYLDILEECIDAPTKQPYTNVGRAISEAEGITNPFKTAPQVELLQKEYTDYKNLSKICGFNKFFAEEIHAKFIGKNVNNIKYRQILNIADVSPLEQSLDVSAGIALMNRQNGIVQRRFAKTHIVLGRLLSGFPIYITNTFCVRLRLYPKEPFISRTTGPFKHILCEHEDIPLTLSGLTALMGAYYTAAGQYLEKFEGFRKEPGLENSSLFGFFSEHVVDFTCLKDNFLYVSLLYVELLKVFETGKSSIMIEIDQKASGLVFIALAYRNRGMAAVSNVISKDKNCPYTYLMSKFPEFYYSVMVKRDLQAFEFLSTSRALHKFASMCYAYSQKTQGRNIDFKERWHEEIGPLPDSAREVLEEFAQRYSEFLEFVFPGLKKQMKIVAKVATIAVKNSGVMNIRNINGMLLSFTCYTHESTTRRAANPITGKLLDYRIETLKCEGGEIEVSLSDHQQKFLSFLIHSVDAAVMHRFIQEMHDKHGYVINHLHDCVLIHPNYVDAFYEIVRELYSSDVFYNVCLTSVFETAKNSVSSDEVPKVERLQKKFIKAGDIEPHEVSNFLPENIYLYES